MSSEIRDVNLWESGETKIQWVKNNMPLLRGIEEEFSAEKPFKGIKIALSVHLEAKTAYLCRVLAAGGAEMCHIVIYPLYLAAAAFPEVYVTNFTCHLYLFPFGFIVHNTQHIYFTIKKQKLQEKKRGIYK